MCVCVWRGIQRCSGYTRGLTLHARCLYIIYIIYLVISSFHLAIKGYLPAATLYRLPRSKGRLAAWQPRDGVRTTLATLRTLPTLIGRAAVAGGSSLLASGSPAALVLALAIAHDPAEQILLLAAAQVPFGFGRLSVMTSSPDICAPSRVVPPSR